MKRLVFIHLFYAVSHFTFGQYVISGNVKDEKGNALFGVNIYIKDTYDGASSDLNGNFYFKSSVSGKQTIVTSYIGYKLIETEVNLVGDLIGQQFELQEEINKIDGVTISAGAFEASDKKKSVILRTFDVVTTAGATADITGVMNTLPGTQTVGEEGKLFVRGGAGHEAKTFINGLLVAEPYGQTPQNIPSRFRFNPFLFKGAFFSTGGYSAEYGQALSSILRLDTYDLPARSQTDISIMSVGADVSHTIKKDNTSLYGQVQYTDLSAYFSLVPQKYEWNDAPKSLNSTVHFKQKFKSAGHIQAYLNYDRSRMKVSQPLPGKIYETGLFDIDNDNFYSNLAIQNSINDRLSYRGGVSFSANKNEILMGEGFSSKSNIRSSHAKLVFDHDASEHIFLRFGAEWIFNDHKEIIVENENNSPLNFDIDNHLATTFAEGDVYFSNALMARIGLRYEYNSLIDNKYIAPRASLAYKLNKNSQFSLAYGKFSQLPVKEYLYWSNMLEPEKATHYIFNYQYNKTGRIFRAELYYKKYEQLVTKEFIYNQSPLLKSDGYGEAKGFELFWRDSKTFKAIDYWVSYSYLDAERKYDIFPAPVMPYYASNHNLSVVYKHFIAQLKSQIGWTYSFASGRPYTDPNTGSLNSEMTKSYNDLSINYSYLLKPNMIIHASLSNVLGFRNIYGYQYNYEPNESGEYESIPIEPQAKRFFMIGFFLTISKDKNANMLNNL